MPPETFEFVQMFLNFARSSPGTGVFYEGEDKFFHGARRLAARAVEVARSGDDADLRVATHLVEMAAQAAPDDGDVHAARAEVYSLRRERETSLMAKSIFGAAARDSEQLSQ